MKIPFCNIVIKLWGWFCSIWQDRTCYFQSNQVNLKNQQHQQISSTTMEKWLSIPDIWAKVSCRNDTSLFQSFQSFNINHLQQYKVFVTSSGHCSRCSSHHFSNALYRLSSPVSLKISADGERNGIVNTIFEYICI